MDGTSQTTTGDELSPGELQIREQEQLKADMLAIVDQARTDGRGQAADLIESFFLGRR